MRTRRFVRVSDSAISAPLIPVPTTMTSHVFAKGLRVLTTEICGVAARNGLSA